MDGDSIKDTDLELDCPLCGTTMESRPIGDGEVNVCPEGHGVFMRRANLGSLVEAELPEQPLTACLLVAHVNQIEETLLELQVGRCRRRGGRRGCLVFLLH